MGRIHGGKSIWNRILFTNRSQLFRTRSFCHPPQNNKPTAINDGSGGSNTNGLSSSSLSQYDEQYKALNNLDFMKAAKILFTDQPKKKKFGLDFHLVQLFFVCLPSLAVYLVAQYARSEMRKMDAELEKKKQAEFEAQAKEMELKAAEEKAAVASNPELLKVKERLDKLEETVRQIAVKPQAELGDSRDEGTKLKHAVKIEPNNVRHGPEVGKTLKEIAAASKEGKTSGFGGSRNPSTEKQNDSKNRGTFPDTEK